MNHCLLEVEVLEAPQVRYTQDNQTPVAEMTVRFEPLRVDDPPGQIKVVGWGSLAQDLQNRVLAGQRLVLEGRLRMNTVSRPDGVKEKRAEFTLARFHGLAGAPGMVAAPASGGPASSAPSSSAPSGAGPASRGPATPSPGRRAAPTPSRTAAPMGPAAGGEGARSAEPPAPVWNSSPLVADPEGFDEDDEIPF